MTQLNFDDPQFDVVLQKSERVLSVQEYSYTQDFLGATDSFSFVYYDEDRVNLSGLEMQPVALRIDGHTQMLGRIEATERGNDGSAVHAEGRDYLSDLVECNVDPRCIIKDGTTLHDAVLYLCAPCGINTINDQSGRYNARTGKVVSKIDAQLSAKNLKDVKPEAGKGIFETCEKLLARYGLMLQPALDRNTVIVQAPSYDYDPLGTIWRTGGDSLHNLVIDATARRDFSSFPTHCLFTGKQGAAVEKGGAKGVNAPWDLYTWLQTAGVEELQTILASAFLQDRNLPDDPKSVLNGVLYRLLYYKDEHAKTQEQIERSQLRAVSDRLRNTLTYTCKVRGHVNPSTGFCWTADALLDVDDDMADVHETLWCYRCVFENSRREGPTTTLTMIRPNTFVLSGEDITTAEALQAKRRRRKR